MFYILRSILFVFPAEISHHLAFKSLLLLERIGLLKYCINKQQSVTEDDKVSVMGLTFPNHVGLAAGLDKDGKYIAVLHRMGFGHIEVGTVTPKGQLGNDKPRMFRLPKAQAIINRMGFNNDGVDALVQRVELLKSKGFDGVLGINIGKNKATEEADAINDYIICMNKVYDLASYITINISSPNTPGLRDLQYGELLHELLSSLKSEQQRLCNQYNKYVPLALKIAPDLTEEEIKRVADAINQHQFDAVIATNTTLSRELVKQHKHADEMGGLSGLPLTEDSLSIIEKLT